VHDQALLARRRPRGARGGGRRETIEHLARGGLVLLCPQRMIEAHRLAPVAESEIGIGLLGLLKRLGGDVEFEIEERLDPGEKRFLRRRFRGRRKMNRPERFGRWRLRRERHRKRRDKRKGPDNADGAANGHVKSHSTLQEIAF
jgi:hypothetical protein